MGKRGQKAAQRRAPFSKPAQPRPAPERHLVDSLLDIMEDGNEYGSIVPSAPKNPEKFENEIRRAIKEIEDIRERPLLCYLANVVKPLPGNEVNSNDDLPFNEMVNKVPDEYKNVDVMVVTPGGSGQQISQFVNSLRPRFDTVEFILPYSCMSAGTLWVFSGDKIWMDKRAYIGPIDPQVRLPDGRYIPAQSLLILMEEIRSKGEEALKKGAQPPWHLIRMLDNIDPRQVGDAITQSDYSIKMATGFLTQFKFKSWDKHSSTGKPVTEQERQTRAEKIATEFCSHNDWKSHAHGITRDVAQTTLKIKIEEPEAVEGLERAIRRLWALMYWLFDQGSVAKLLISSDYILVRNAIMRQ